MRVALVVVGLVGVLVSSVGITVGACRWTYRRVSASHGVTTATIATVVAALFTEVGGWLLFGPAWLLGHLSRRLRSTPGPARSGRFVLRLLAAGGVAGLSLGVVAFIGGLTAVGRQDDLRRRGVVVAAQALTVHYDPDGGDPGGWTSIRAQFVDTRGYQRTVTVGHHDQATEAVGGTVDVLYDPMHPSIAAYAPTAFETTPFGDAVVGVVVAALGLTIAVGFILLSRRPQRTAQTADRLPWPPPVRHGA